jgi:hypothetical protein
MATVDVEPPRLREASFADFADIHRLESEFFSEVFPLDERRAVFEENPLWPRLADRWPVGWVLEDSSGTIVGSVTNVPSRYLYRGEEKICANGHSWVTTFEHRAYAALLMDEYFNQDGVDLALTPVVGPDALGIWRAYGTPMPLGEWTRIAYAVTNRRAFAREALAMLGVPWAAGLSVPVAAALAAKEALRPRSLPETPDGVEIVESRGFDERFEVFWEELRAREHDMLLAVRDRATLEWHFGLPLRAGRLWVYTANRDGRIRAYLVIKQLDRANGIHSMMLIDYQTVDTAIDLLPGLVRAAASRCASEGNSVLEHRGCEVPKMRSFDEFAPYRRNTGAWAFHFLAFDPVLAAELTRPTVWDPSDYDGGVSHR